MITHVLELSKHFPSEKQRMSESQEPTPSFPNEETESQEVGVWPRITPHSFSEAEEMYLLKRVLSCLVAKGARKDKNYTMA